MLQRTGIDRTRMDLLREQLARAEVGSQEHHAIIAEMADMLRAAGIETREEKWRRCGRFATDVRMGRIKEDCDE